MELEEKIGVSIFSLAYNHEKYIEKCLEGFVKQKTNFRFEVLIHDDASTDSTASIIRIYQKRYPDIIRPVFQKENQYSKHIPIVKTFLLPKARGKYVAYCEGDDFWSDPLKLQKQFDALELNTSCSFSSHHVDTLTPELNSTGSGFPEENLNTGLYSTKDTLFYFSKINFFHLNSLFFQRKILLEVHSDLPSFWKKSAVGDMPLFLYLVSKGDMFYFNETMSKYVRGTIGSWTKRIYVNRNTRVAHLTAMLDCLVEYDIYTKKKYHDLMMKRIVNTLYQIAETRGSYFVFFKKKYRFIFREAFPSLKKKIFIVCYAFFPKGATLIRRLFGKKQ